MEMNPSTSTSRSSICDGAAGDYYVKSGSEVEETTFLTSIQRHRNYGTTTAVGSSRRLYDKTIIHELLPEDTLQGLALRYDTTMSDIKRCNRLWSAESLHLKPTVTIPILDSSDHSVASSSEENHPTSTSALPNGKSVLCKSNSSSALKSISRNSSDSNFQLNSIVDSQADTEQTTTSTNSNGTGGERPQFARTMNGSSFVDRTELERRCASTAFTPTTDVNEDFQDIFKRIDRTIKTSRKQIKKIGRQFTEEECTPGSPLANT